MTISIGAISNSQYSLRWRQPYVSESLNRKVSLLARGIMQGFRPEAGLANSQVVLRADTINGISLAQLAGRSGANQFTLTLRFAGDQTIDLSTVLTAGDLGKEFALVIRPQYVIGSPTVVTWELVPPAEYVDALLDDVLVVGFLRVDGTDLANPLAEVFIAGASQSRGASLGWGRQSLMVDYAKMGAPTGDADGQMLELLYDGGDADMARWSDFLAHYGPQGDVAVTQWNTLLTRDRVDTYALQYQGLELPINPVTMGPPDGLLFQRGYIHIADGPTADGYPNMSVRVGGYNASWYSAPTPISVGTPLVAQSSLVSWFPCRPGDQFIVQMYVKSGGGDSIYPAAPYDPLILNGVRQSGLGAFWAGDNRKVLDKIVQVSPQSLGVLGGEEIHALDPEQGASFVHSKSWTLYREVFTCPKDYSNVPTEHQAPRWFAPFWKFVLGSQGHLQIAGIKVWRVRRGSDHVERGGYDEYRLASTADASPLGEAGRLPAAQPGRFGGGLVLNPPGTKLLPPDSTTQPQNYYDAVPLLLAWTDPATFQERIPWAPNILAYSGIAPSRHRATGFSNPVPAAVGAPTHNLNVLTDPRTRQYFERCTIEEYTSDAPGIWEHLLRGGMVLRAEPDPVANAYSDVRFCLSDPPTTLVPWSPYDGVSPRWCVREDGSVESNAHNIPVQGAQLQGSSEWGAKARLFRDSDPGVSELIGQQVVSALIGGMNPAILGTGNNMYKGYEAARAEWMAAFHTPWSYGWDGTHAEYHLDLTDGYSASPVIARLSESGPFAMQRCLNLWTLSADNPVYTGSFGATTVLELVNDDASALTDEVDGQSVALLGKMVGAGALGGWPFVAGGLVLRRGQTTETSGPFGYRGDAVLSLFNSKAGVPVSHYAIDPWGCEHHYAGGNLDTLPYVYGMVGIHCAPGGDTLPVVTMGGQPAAAIYNWMPTDTLPGLSANMRIDAYGRLFKDVTAFTEFHYYARSQGWDTPIPGDVLHLTSSGEVEMTSAAMDKAVVGIYTGQDGQWKDVQNSYTGQMAQDFWVTGQEVPVDWSRFAYNKDDPPRLVEPDPQTWPHLVQVAAVGDNRVFAPDGTPALPGFNVVSEGGDIAVGDLLCSSSTPGKMMKQADDVVHSYTVGRALQAVVFSGGAPSPTYGVYGILMCG